MERGTYNRITPGDFLGVYWREEEPGGGSEFYICHRFYFFVRKIDSETWEIIDFSDKNNIGTLVDGKVPATEIYNFNSKDRFKIP
jgi:hypothetical protein